MLVCSAREGGGWGGMVLSMSYVCCIVMWIKVSLWKLTRVLMLTRRHKDWGGSLARH